MVAAPKDVSTRTQDLSMPELLGRLAQQTVALTKAEIGRVKAEAVAMVGPAARAIVLGTVALIGFTVGLAAFGFALYFGVESLTNSPVIAALVVGGAAWFITFVTGGLALAGLRAMLAAHEERGS